ncbi:DUF4317 domain-containing protein [Clostridium sporogenes]|uniref:DUF4317 domain-containing protein n=1 Tax=Clostridium botulinum TaxID=1491 RepID=A0A6M0SWL1_CLOBO|nr:DUF4317 domain-containing protein [Clostridium sporogenes]NFA59876.1 DUF4317 domain-containing protein [Clostridium botulinum]NFI74051.1 DUF4317 domain-containing protein [Clostridium sporogenes]NFL71765.1 DUF4317 domain-containing protein [Clostridium sporogenes]NFM24621.1 DUF4317 domain-containing protein [Clostridium sporogenes]NFP61925.1 DUF4317 domain-containing protein [Clostridium sporogenes]
MKKKDILELKKRLKKDYCTFTKICGCYVNGEKNIVLNFRESFLNLDEDEYFKYLEIAKKVLSGTIGNNILELNFPLNENLENEKQLSLVKLKKSQLKDDALLQDFYNSIIDSYDYTGNFLILVFHDTYDVITKTTDNSKIDESEEIYEYILCAICPVSLSDPGLRYFEEENKIKARIRDWVVNTPTLGFVFPAFINRTSDVNSVMYYTKNAKDPHPELMEETLGCFVKQTATIQKETFQTIIKDSIDTDEKKAEKTFMEIQENLNTMIDEYKEIYNDKDDDPVTLTQKDIQNLLMESGVPEQATTKIEKSYVESFGKDFPLAENLIDAKALKANAQIQKEEQLKKQVKVLQTKLEQVQQNSSVDTNNNLPEEVTNESILEENHDSNLEDNDNNVASKYDVILQVKPEKIPQIKSQIIDGQKCIVIPINNDEQTTVNGLDDLI